MPAKKKKVAKKTVIKKAKSKLKAKAAKSKTKVEAKKKTKRKAPVSPPSKKQAVAKKYVIVPPIRIKHEEVEYEESEPEEEVDFAEPEVEKPISPKRLTVVHKEKIPKRSIATLCPEDCAPENGSAESTRRTLDQLDEIDNEATEEMEALEKQHAEIKSIVSSIDSYEKGVLAKTRLGSMQPRPLGKQSAIRSIPAGPEQKRSPVPVVFGTVIATGLVVAVMLYFTKK